MKRNSLIKGFLSVVFLGLLVTMQNCGGGSSFARVAANSSSSTGQPSAPAVPVTAVSKALNLGLLTKNMDCVLCHLNVNGNISGFDTVTFRSNSSGNIFGNIYAPDEKFQYWGTAGLDTTVIDPIYVAAADVQRIATVVPSQLTNNLNKLADGSYVVKPGEVHNTTVKVNADQGEFGPMSFPSGGGLYTLTNISASNRAVAQANMMTDGDGNPIIDATQFPQLNPTACAATVTGSIQTSDGHVYNSPIDGNSIFVNGTHQTAGVSGAFNSYDPSCPSANTLKISGEVVVKGDLIIAGCFSGRGTIYATGNIYVPDDIKTLNSAFPFPGQNLTDLAANDQMLTANVNVKTNTDMMSLGAAGFIVIGSLSTQIITNGQQDIIFQQNLTQFNHLNTWLASTTTAAASLYSSSYLKKPFADSGATPGAVSMVEANLFANIGIASTLIGTTNTNILINGSVITPNLSILASGFSHSHVVGTTNPFNGQTFDHSQINEDYRMKYSNAGFECARQVGN